MRGICPIFVTFFLLVTLGSLTAMTWSYKAPGQSITETIGRIRHGQVWGGWLAICNFITIFTTGIAFFLQTKCFKLLDVITVVFIWESTKPHLCSKLSLFKTPWQMLEVELQLSTLVSSLTYLKAFQWGTVWPYTSRGIKKRQVKVEKSKFTS